MNKTSLTLILLNVFNLTVYICETSQDPLNMRKRPSFPIHKDFLLFFQRAAWLDANGLLFNKERNVYDF